jgi:hypothetical protein
MVWRIIKGYFFAYFVSAFRLNGIEMPLVEWRSRRRAAQEITDAVSAARLEDRIRVETTRRCAAEPEVLLPAIAAPLPPRIDAVARRPRENGAMYQAAAIFLGFVVLSITVCFIGRYETAVTPSGFAIVTDRWLGTVSICGSVNGTTVFCVPRFPATPLPSVESLLGPAPRQNTP